MVAAISAKYTAMLRVTIGSVGDQRFRLHCGGVNHIRLEV